MFTFFSTPEKQRKKLLATVENKVLRKYLEEPLPDRNKYISELEFLALDFETTGLDAKEEAILSIGYTVISQGKIQLKNNGHHFIMVNREIPAESVTIHKITDDRAKQGEHLHDVLEKLLNVMAGKVLLVHYDKIERNFLNAACEEIYGDVPPILIVDTLAIAKKKLDRLNRPYAAKGLRLFNLRKELGLPRYYAHSALEDAIATAELFLAQMAHSKGMNATRLKELLN